MWNHPSGSPTLLSIICLPKWKACGTGKRSAFRMCINCLLLSTISMHSAPVAATPIFFIFLFWIIYIWTIVNSLLFFGVFFAKKIEIKNRRYVLHTVYLFLVQYLYCSRVLFRRTCKRMLDLSDLDGFLWTIIIKQSYESS